MQPPDPHGPPQAQPAPERRPNQELEYIVPINVAPLALVAGYAGLGALFCVPAPIALVLGVLALRDLARNPNRSGKGRAWFGVIAGALGTVGLLFWLVTRLAG